MSEDQTIRASGFVVFRRVGSEIRFLLIKSARDSLWGLPKGHLLPGESPMDAALRELKEETGYDDIVVLSDFHWGIDYTVLRGLIKKSKRVDYFLGEKKGADIKLSGEHLDYRWVTLKEAKRLLTFDNLTEVLRKAHEAASSPKEESPKRKGLGPRGSALILFLIIILGVSVRVQNFTGQGYANRDAFPIESAQRHRYISMVARGQGIPRIDRAIQHPQGFNSRSDTILQEYLVGYAYRLFSFTNLPLETFLRYFLRMLWVLTVIPIYLIALQSTGSRGAALISALFFALAMPSLRRSLGNEIYREHISFLPLGLHVYYLLRAFACKDARRKFYLWALLSASFLLICLIAWKANRFYYLTLMIFFMFMLLSSSRREHAVKLLAFFAIINVSFGLLLDTPLRYDLFHFSPGMILTYSLLGAGFIQLTFKKTLVSAGVFLLVAALFWMSRPETGFYTHVWQTMFAKLRYFSKPELPSLLPFEARHYWVPPYTSPTAFMMINDFLLPLLAVLIAVKAGLLNLFKRQSSFGEELLLYMSAAFLGFYLLFYKLMTFLVFFASPFMAIAYKRAGELPSGRRKLAMGLVMATLALAAYQSQTWDDNYLARGLKGLGINPLSLPQAIPNGATEELISWFRSNTLKGEAVLAEFPSSTALLAYAGRPVVLQSLFEGDNRFRFREFSYALISGEERLFEMMKKYRARYFIYSAHFLLRTDNNMSYRYTADAMKIDPGWTIYLMHFHPQRLKHFSLVYQNSVFRVFRLLEEGETVSFSPPLYAPVFDESLLASLKFSLSTGVTREEAFLYTLVPAYNDLYSGLRMLASGEKERGLKILLRSEEIFPFIPDTHSALAAYYLSTNDLGKAKLHTEKAGALRAGEWRKIAK